MKVEPLPAKKKNKMPVGSVRKSRKVVNKNVPRKVRKNSS